MTGLNRKTAGKNPMIIKLYTILSSLINDLYCNATDKRKKKLKIKATLEKKRSIVSLWFIVYSLWLSGKVANVALYVICENMEV